MKAIGLDIGTTTICAAVVDLTCGDAIKIQTVQNDSAVPSQNTWERLQDPEKITDICIPLLDRLIDEYPDIVSLGISGQMHGIIYMGNGQAKSMLVTWQDGRGNLVLNDGISCAQKLTEATGIASASGYGLVSVLYDALTGAIPAGAEKICTIGDYTGMKICGNNVPLLHASNAAGLGGYCPGSNRFSPDLPSEIDRALLPEIIPGEMVIGKYRGIPVSCAVGDNQSSVFGSLGNGVNALVNIGTGGQISSVSEAFIKYDNDLECRPYTGGRYLSVGASLCGGYALQVLKEFFSKTAGMFGVDPPPDLYGKMDALASQVMNSSPAIDFNDIRKNASRLNIDTRFAGTRRDTSIRGTISGIGTDNFTPGNLCLGVLEGICVELRELSIGFKPALARGGCLAASGGGVRKSAVLQDILKKIFEMEIIIPVCYEEASFGAALISSVAAGIIDASDAGSLVRYE